MKNYINEGGRFRKGHIHLKTANTAKALQFTLF